MDNLGAKLIENNGLLSLEHKLRASTALAKGDTRNAILHQTHSLGASMRQKFSQMTRRSSDLEELVEQVIKCGINHETAAQRPTTDSQDGFTDLCKRCDELPNEWTVIQIAKEFNPMATGMVHEELVVQPAEVWFTVFACSDPCEGTPFEPILIPMDAPAEQPDTKYPNYFAHIAAIPSEVQHVIANHDSAAASSDSQAINEDVEQLISTAVERTREWLGPWSNLLVGKFRSPTDQKLESEIYNQIEEFCVHNRINRTVQRLVSLVARRLDLLNDLQLFELCCSEQLDLDDANVEALYDLLIELREQKFPDGTKDRLDCYPVVLIIDELLDSMPWEMLHPTGEFSRFANFWTLSELYRMHAPRIKNGYFRLSAKRCFAIINPDKTLEKMSARLQLFYKEWFPDFELLIDQAPNESELGEALNSSDVFIYNGHGSGFQFMNGEALLQHDINCVTFLFGCDSVRLFSNGLFTEMTGTHMYYNAARCPTVIGALWLLTDILTDTYSMLLVGNWIPSTNPAYAKQNISSLDTKAFKAGKWQFKTKSSSTQAIFKKHPNLLKLMGDCRMFCHMPLRMRSALVCRGLPAINDACI